MVSKLKVLAISSDRKEFRITGIPLTTGRVMYSM